MGIQEAGGANRGQDVEAWLTRAGAVPGDPWCASFASWCISVAGLPIVRQAGAQALGKRFPAVTGSVSPGDVMWFPTGPWQGHCGIVVGVGVEHVATVEGNNNNAVRIVRRVRDDVSFSSPAHEAPPGPAPVPDGLPLMPAHTEGTR